MHNNNSESNNDLWFEIMAMGVFILFVGILFGIIDLGQTVSFDPSKNLMPVVCFVLGFLLIFGSSIAIYYNKQKIKKARLKREFDVNLSQLLM